MLVKEEGIVCYSTRGSHKHNYDQVHFYLSVVRLPACWWFHFGCSLRWTWRANRFTLLEGESSQKYSFTSQILLRLLAIDCLMYFLFSCRYQEHWAWSFEKILADLRQHASHSFMDKIGNFSGLYWRRPLLWVSNLVGSQFQHLRLILESKQF